MTFTDRMKAELDEVAGAEFERLAESHARERWPIDHRPHKLGEKWRLGFVIGAVWARGMFRRDAEKAERERDEARRERDSWRAQVPLADWEKDLIQATENPRPLTPDAITDEMVERARAEADAWGHQVSDVGMRHILGAALTEPPARPEGAEDIERVILDYKRENAHRGYSEADLADRIAEEMNR